MKVANVTTRSGLIVSDIVRKQLGTLLCGCTVIDSQRMIAASPGWSPRASASSIEDFLLTLNCNPDDATLCQQDDSHINHDDASRVPMYDPTV